MTECRKSGQIEIFAGLSVGQRTQLHADSKVIDCKREVIIRPAGEIPKYVFSILSGQVQIYRGSNNKQAVLMMLGAGEVFGLRYVLNAEIASETAETVHACRLLKTPIKTFRCIVDQDPRFAKAVAYTLSRRLQMVSDHFERIQLLPAQQRLAEYLIRFAPENGDAYEVNLPYEKKLIASYLGMDPASLSRAMKKLRDFGLTCDGPKVCVRDPKGLRRACSQLHTADANKRSSIPGSLTTRNPI